MDTKNNLANPDVRMVVASLELSDLYRGRAGEIVWKNIQQNEKERCCGR